VLPFQPESRDIMPISLQDENEELFLKQILAVFTRSFGERTASTAKFSDARQNRDEPDQPLIFTSKGPAKPRSKFASDSQSNRPYLSTPGTSC
jgi:hypothetical protein